MGSLHLEGFSLILPAVALQWLIRKRVNPKKSGAKTFKALLMTATCLIGGLGVAYSFVGDLLASCVHWITGMSSALAIGVPFALVIVTAGVVAADVANDRNADKGAQIAAWLAPTMLVLVIAGTIGATGGDIARGSYTTVHHIVVQLSGSRG